jgi:tRNA (guanine-N7-)-methyltransferase
MQTPQDIADSVEHPRHIRSFVRRAGRLTTGQAKALDALGPLFLIPFQSELLDFEQLGGFRETINSVALGADSMPKRP